MKKLFVCTGALLLLAVSPAGAQFFISSAPAHEVAAAQKADSACFRRADGKPVAIETVERDSTGIDTLRRIDTVDSDLIRLRDGGHVVAHLHDDAVNIAVGDQQVRAVADEERLRAAVSHNAADGRRLLRGRGAHECTRRSADAKRAVRAHRFIFQNLQLRQLLAQRADDGVQIRHNFLFLSGSEPDAEVDAAVVLVGELLRRVVAHALLAVVHGGELEDKKHFISSDCLISKGDTRLWQKDL